VTQTNSSSGGTCGDSNQICFEVPETCQGNQIEATLSWEYSAEIQLVRSDLNLGSMGGSCSACNTIVPETYNPTPIPSGSVLMEPVCLTGFSSAISFWKLTNTNPQNVTVYVKRRTSSLSDLQSYLLLGYSSLNFETSEDKETDVYELYIKNGNTYVLVDSSSPPGQNCPVNASGCCDKITLKNPNTFSISILYEVYSLSGALETRSPLILYPCSTGAAACTFTVPQVSVGASLKILQQTLTGQLATVEYSREQLTTDCPENCAVVTTGTTSSPQTTSTSTTRTTGTTGVTTWTIPTTSTGSTTSSVCPEVVKCKYGGALWDPVLCKCTPCPITNQTCLNQGQVFDEIACHCDDKDSTSGGGGSKDNSAAITGGTVTAGTVAGAAAAALYFLAKRKKKPEEEVVDADLTFANVIESNPLYQDPMPTYDNPIYEGGDEHPHGHEHESHSF